MSALGEPTQWSRLAIFGRCAFGLATLAFGVTHLIYADFVTRIVPPWPAWVPGRPIWACVVGVVLALSGFLITLGGIGSIGGRATRIAALSVGTILVLSLVFLFAPLVAARPGFGGAWTPLCKVLALAGGAFLIAGLHSGSRGPAAAVASGVVRPDRLARILLAGFMILGGIQHFVYAAFVATLVPAWIPGHAFWTYFAGVALIAGGAGLLIPRTVRVAALLSGGMIFTWFLILHIPRAVASAGDTGEWSGVFESLAISGIAFLIAGNPARRNG